MNNVYDELKERGLINQVTDEDIKKRLLSKITLYCGFDPTGDSLHVGHLLPIVILKHFENYGHQNIALVGGATGLIGDPSGKKEERVLNTVKTVQDFSNKIENQLNRFLSKDTTIFENNYNWASKLNVIEFLRDYGKNFGINYMLNKDSVSSRLESGISFTEFSYTILQAMDFDELYKNYNCELQIGGSDQWGNITSGLELIRKNNEDSKAYGLTIPLVMKSDGTKFGKTAGGAVWLDPKKTTPYEFYQFFLNVVDEDVIKYLKYFTFLSHKEIKELENSVKKDPHLREAQKTLAYNVTGFVHGYNISDMVVKISKALFSGDITSLSVKEIEENFAHIKKYEIDKQMSLIDLVVTIELASSKREAREFIVNGAISIANKKCTDENMIVDRSMGIGNVYLMVKRGKKKISLVRFNG